MSSEQTLAAASRRQLGRAQRRLRQGAAELAQIADGLDVDIAADLHITTDPDEALALIRELAAEGPIHVLVTRNHTATAPK